MIERFRQGGHYYVLPGGGVEEGETIEQAARREAAEELGVPVRLGPLRALVRSSTYGGSVQRHWCFEASVDSEDIAIAGGPELDAPSANGTYEAVWLDFEQLASRDVYPAALAKLIAANRCSWPETVIEVAEP